MNAVEETQGKGRTGISSRVVVLEEVSEALADGWTLRFQWCRYNYSNKTKQMGFRFIWSRPNGNLQGARGQARIPSIELIRKLIAEAEKQGWGGKVGEMGGYGAED